MISTVSEYKMRIQKSAEFLYTNNNQPKKKAISFTIAPKKDKILRKKSNQAGEGTCTLKAIKCLQKKAE